MVKKIVLILAIALFGIENITGQEAIGLISGNYSGVNGAMINPSSINFNKSRLDVRIMGLHTFADNNFYYIPRGYNYGLGFINKSPQVFGDDKQYLYYTDDSPKDLLAVNRILLPGFRMDYKDHSFAFGASQRSYISATNIPYEVPIIAYKGLTFEDIQNIRYSDFDFKARINSWTELAFSYSYVAVKSFDHRLSVGASAKILLGNAASYVNLENARFFITSDTTIHIEDLKTDLGYAVPLDFESNDFDGDPLFKGRGFAIDLGVTYVRTKRAWRENRFRKRQCEIPYEDYIFKVGVSLLDVGSINYKSNARVHNYDMVSAAWKDPKINFESMNQLFYTFDTLFYGPGGAGKSVVADKFRMPLPTAVSVQADAHLYPNFYVNLLWVQSAPLLENTVRRPNLLAISPRYESRLFDFGIPISLYEYEKLRMGMYARIGFFTIGTERLGSYIGFGDLTGADVYFSFKFGIPKGKCYRKYETPCHRSSKGFEGF